MADTANVKQLNTRIRLKYDLLENWLENDPVLLEGEIALATIKADTTYADESVFNTKMPNVVMKVGDGQTQFSKLNYFSAMAADVHAWAKDPNKPSYEAKEITGMEDFIAKYVGEEMGIEVDTNTLFQIVKVGDYEYKLQSKGKTDSAWADVECDHIIIPNMEAVIAAAQTAADNAQAAVDALAGKVGEVAEGKTVVGLIGEEAARADAAEKALAKKIGTVADDTDLAAMIAAEASRADTAEKAAQAAAAAAQKTADDVTALVGTLPADAGEGIDTVVKYIDKKTADITSGTEFTELEGRVKAIEDDYLVEADKTALTNAINGKVASVAAKDNSVVIGGEATAPTVGVQISAGAGNALSLADDGLMVTLPTAAEYSIVKDETAGDGFAATYHLTKDGTNVGAAINIPKDMVVQSGTVVTDPEGQPAGTYIKLVLANAENSELYIPVDTLIEYVTSGSQTGDMIVINVSDDHKVTATITDGTITAAKLTTEVQTALNKAHTHANAEELDKIAIGDKAKWDAAEQNAKGYADGLNTAMNTRVEALEAIDHDHANKAELDLIATGDKAKWDAAAGKAHEHANKVLLDTYTQTEADLADAVAKKHEHANADVLAGVTAEKVADWDDAVSKEHEHANADVLAGITAENITDWNDAVAKEHEHANAEELAKFVDGDKEKLDSAVQTVTAGAGLKATKTGTDVAIDIDEDTTFTFYCGTSSDLI